MSENRNRLLTALVLGVASLVPGVLPARPVEDAIELARVELVDREAGEVNVFRWSCPSCEPEKFLLDPAVRFFVDGKPVTWEYLLTGVDKSATVIYRIETGRIVTVLW